MSNSNIFRYPGGKSKYLKNIISKIEPLLEKNKVFHDVFCGGGSVSIEIAKKFKDVSININDLDPHIYSFWKILVSHNKNEIKELLKHINQKPTIELFNYMRLSKPITLVEKAYYGIFFNRTTFSGISTAGPIGGKDQKSKWKIDCRYNADKIIKSFFEVRKLLLNRTKVTNFSFKNYLADNKAGIYYFDPPYFEKGESLYPVFLTKREHFELAELLKNIKNWVLSYDNHPVIRTLYEDNKIEYLDYRYSINGKKNGWKEKKELLITK